MRGADSLPELQMYLSTCDNDKKEEPMIPLDDVTGLIACIGVLPNMEEPDDNVVARHLDQFFSRVVLSQTHSTDYEYTQVQDQEDKTKEKRRKKGSKNKA